MYKDYTIEDVTKMVNCCYFVGSCRMCPFFKRSGFANIGKCSGEKEVGKALLGILEPLLEAEKAKKQPTLFEMDEGPDMDAVDADPIEAETIDDEEQEQTEDVDDLVEGSIIDLPEDFKDEEE